MLSLHKPDVANEGSTIKTRFVFFNWNKACDKLYHSESDTYFFM